MMWNFERFGDRTALVDEHGASLTYRQLKREADALCAAAGGRCLTFNLCRNTLGSLLGYAGFVEGGVVPVLLNEEMDRELLKGVTPELPSNFVNKTVAKDAVAILTILLPIKIVDITESYFSESSKASFAFLLPLLAILFSLILFNEEYAVSVAEK